MTAAIIPSRIDYTADWAADVATDVRGIAGRTLRWLGLAALVFFGWAALFPLDSAVVADGVVIAEGRNRLVQHRVGGTVIQMLVGEGDHVRQGQPILRLDPVEDRAQLTQLRARLAMLRATRARLEAENRAAAGDAPALSPADAGAALGPAGRDLLIEQERAFVRGRGAVRAQIDAVEAKIAATRTRADGLDQRIARMREQLTLLNRQLASKRRLAAKGGLARSGLWEFEAMVLAQRGELEQLRADRRAADQDIGESRAEIEGLKLADQRETSNRLTEVIGEIAQLTDKVAAAEAAVAATEVRAPVAGRLVHVRQLAAGAVVAPGEAVAEVVPDTAPLAVRVRVAPADINHVSIGRAVQVTVSALDARLYDPLAGRVATIAPDATIDERTGHSYFDVTVALDALPRGPDGKRLIDAGMAGQTFIAGDRRTFLAYVMKPFIDSYRRAFREP